MLHHTNNQGPLPLQTLIFCWAGNYMCWSEMEHVSTVNIISRIWNVLSWSFPDTSCITTPVTPKGRYQGPVSQNRRKSKLVHIPKKRVLILYHTFQWGVQEVRLNHGFGKYFDRQRIAKEITSPPKWPRIGRFGVGSAVGLRYTTLVLRSIKNSCDCLEKICKHKPLPPFPHRSLFAGWEPEGAISVYKETTAPFWLSVERYTPVKPSKPTSDRQQIEQEIIFLELTKNWSIWSRVWSRFSGGEDEV